MMQELLTLPTPSARDWKGKTNPGVVKEGSGCIYGETVPDAVDRLFGNLLPTPLTRDYKGGTTAIRKDTGKIRTDALDSCVKYMAENGLLPTPITSDSQGGARKIGENGRTLRKSSGENFSASLKDTVVGAAAAAGISSRLNPLFTEEMMGFPLMWTSWPFLLESGERNQ
jgi:hypothetical protein